MIDETTLPPAAKWGANLGLRLAAISHAADQMKAAKTPHETRKARKVVVDLMAVIESSATHRLLERDVEATSRYGEYVLESVMIAVEREVITCLREVLGQPRIGVQAKYRPSPSGTKSGTRSKRRRRARS